MNDYRNNDKRLIMENGVLIEVPLDWKEKEVSDASQQPQKKQQANTSSNRIGCSWGIDCPTSVINTATTTTTTNTTTTAKPYKFKEGDRVRNIHTRTFGTVVGGPHTVNTQSVLVYPVRFDVNLNVVELAPENSLEGPF